MLDKLKSVLYTWPLYLIHKLLLVNYIPLWMYILTILTFSSWLDWTREDSIKYDRSCDKPNYKWRFFYLRYKSSLDFIIGMIFFAWFECSVWLILTTYVTSHMSLVIVINKLLKDDKLKLMLRVYQEVTKLLWWLIVTSMEFLMLCSFIAYLITWSALLCWAAIWFGVKLTKATIKAAGLSGWLFLFFIIGFSSYITYILCVELRHQFRRKLPGFLHALEISIACSLNIDSEAVKQIIINRKRRLLIKQKDEEDAKKRRLNAAIVARAKADGLRLTRLENIRLTRYKNIKPRTKRSIVVK